VQVAGLRAHLASTQQELADLQHQAELSTRRLARAGRLVGALGDEAVRWKVSAGRHFPSILLLML
jgi:hypothetical protein